MTEIQQDNLLHQVFLKKRQEQTNVVLDEAQRLVNLYRHSKAFGKEFIQELDEQLLNMSPEVQSALSDISGGKVVRQYYDFLSENSGKTSSENEEDTIQAGTIGYLPTPEQDMFTPQASVGQGNAELSEATIKTMMQEFFQFHCREIENILTLQNERFAELIHQVVKKNGGMTSEQADKLIEAIKMSKTTPYYPEVIETGTSDTSSFVTEEGEGI